MKRFGAFSIATVLVGCGSTQNMADVPDPLEYKMTVTLMPGQEVHRCQYVTAPNLADTDIVGGSHSYSPGSHHLVLFRTDLTAIPTGMTDVVDCYESGNSMMSHVRGVIYAAQVPTGDTHFPDGVGLPMTPGEVYLFQSHYINASTQSVTATVDVKLKSAPAGAITQTAGVLFYYDPFIYVPAQSDATAHMTCAIPNDVTLISANPHTHARSYGYKAFLDGADGTLATEPFYTSADWEHPTAWTGAPMKIPANSSVRFECAYHNPSQSEYYQGQSASDNEMCMFIGVYYPAMARADEFCRHGPFMFGTGQNTCGDTLGCLTKCPPGSAPKIFGGSGNGSTVSTDVDPCWQRCITTSCSSAWPPLVDSLLCIGKMCGAMCNGADASACQTCIINSCGTQIGACQSATCN